MTDTWSAPDCRAKKLSLASWQSQSHHHHYCPQYYYHHHHFCSHYYHHHHHDYPHFRRSAGLEKLGNVLHTTHHTTGQPAKPVSPNRHHHHHHCYHCYHHSLNTITRTNTVTRVNTITCATTTQRHKKLKYSGLRLFVRKIFPDGAREYKSREI